MKQTDARPTHHCIVPGFGAGTQWPPPTKWRCPQCRRRWRLEDAPVRVVGRQIVHEAKWVPAKWWQR